MYYTHGTPLEMELEPLNADDRAKRIKEVWNELRRSRAFDLLTLTLRDLEWQALTRIKQQPTKDNSVAGITMHVVDHIRRIFESLSRGVEQDATAIEPGHGGSLWADDVDFWDFDDENTARGEVDAPART